MSSEASGRVVVVGSVNIDLVLICSDLPTPGETVLATSLTIGFGGKGANQAVAAAAMGPPTRLIARVGNDLEATHALDDLRAAGVEVDLVVADESAPTGRAVVMVDPHGENCIAVVGGANGLLSADQVDRALAHLEMTVDDVVVTSGETPMACVAAVARHLTDRGHWVHNAAPAGPLPVGADGRHPVLVVNEVESRQLTGVLDTSTAALTLARSAAGVVVTRGAAGAVAVEGGRCEHISSPVVEVVDTTGAGDVFCGVLAAGLARGQSLVTAARAATAAGAFAVTGAGARGAVPRPEDLSPVDPRLRQTTAPTSALQRSAT